MPAASSVDFMRDLFGDTLDEAILAAEELLADYFLELEQQQANEQTKVFPGDVLEDSQGINHEHRLCK